MHSDRRAPLLDVKRRIYKSLEYLQHSRMQRRLRAQGRDMTAMLRVRNEGQFLDAAVRSVVDLVAEVVIIDNASTDATPDVIIALKQEFPTVKSFHYPHRLFRVGEEYVNAMQTVATDDPRKLSTYSNFCLDCATMPFVLKWDGDMVATDRGRDLIRSWAGRAELTCWFPGTNLAPDRIHRLASLEPVVDAGGDRNLPGPEMLRSLAVAFTEPRIFPRAPTRFIDSRSWETATGPFIHGARAERVTLDITDSCYLHLKYCKDDPHSNQSESFAATIREQARPGDPLSDDERDALRWLAPTQPRSGDE